MKIKPKKCIECGRDDQPWFSKKRCKFCAQKSYKRPTKNTNSVASKKKDMKRQELTEFFDRVIESLGGPQRCTESHQSIKTVGRVNIAHIFPKRTYESVMCSDLNYVLLSWDQHTKFDSLLDKFDFESLEQEFPRTWPIVIEKVKEMLDRGLVSEEKKLKLKFEEYFKTVK